MKTFNLILLFWVTMCISCVDLLSLFGPPSYSYRITNNAEYDICVGIWWGWVFSGEYQYPDTSLLEWDGLSFIKANSYHRGDFKHPLDKLITRDIPSDTISIFFFHADTIIMNHWQLIRRDYNILRRYDLSSQDIVKLKEAHGGRFPEIPYPPDERMKNMKMWPPYGK